MKGSTGASQIEGRIAQMQWEVEDGKGTGLLMNRFDLQTSSISWLISSRLETVLDLDVELLYVARVVTDRGETQTDYCWRAMR